MRGRHLCDGRGGRATMRRVASPGRRPPKMSLKTLLAAGMCLSLLANLCAADKDEAQAQAAARAAIVRRIDEVVLARIESAGHRPAPAASDAEFLRRVYLDLTGAIPRVA